MTHSLSSVAVNHAVLSSLIMKALFALLLLFPCFLSAAPVSRTHWVIVFDAGSTKTEMNLYQLRLKTGTSKWIPLRSESKIWTTALSQYDPKDPTDRKQIMSQFRALFNFAETLISSAKDRRQTPVFLYATAGLRGLPKTTAEALLALSRLAISRSSFDKAFNKKEMKRVQMISGTQEGQFAWLSVNYLVSPDIDNQKSTNDLGVVDMGGGSTQIVFRPHDFAILKAAGIDPKSLWYAGNQNRIEANKTGPGVFSKSFADFGFSATAMKYVGAYDDCRPKHKCPAGKSYSSVCLNPDFSSVFKFGPYTFNISGEPLSNPKQRFSRCIRTARRILKKYGADATADMSAIKILLRHEDTVFFGVAGYYYLVKDYAKRTSVDVPSADTPNDGRTRCDGYEMLLRKFREGAKQLCENVPDSTDRYLPYVCIRASYVTVLLEEAYKFKPGTVYHMCNKMPVRRSEVAIGWPLGVAQQAAEKVLEKFKA